ncbi:ATP-binding protein [Altericista sp. CCNU0014]|uniref:ATP-binding protein n=1 Tax=Altericista sp. CCNU0014 TaxID=3082949 RepID=UPI00384AA96D
MYDPGDSQTVVTFAVALRSSPNHQPPPTAKVPATPSATQARQKVPLRFILVVPYVVQLAAAVSLVGWLSFQQGQNAVKQVAAQLRLGLVRQIGHHLEDMLTEPTQINQINLAVTEIGALKFDDSDRLGRLFHRQLQTFPHVGYINYATERNHFIGAERQSDGKIVLLQSRQDDPTRFLNYQLDTAGRKLDLYETYDPISVKEEGWYAQAAKAGKPIWTSIYQWQQRPEVLSISASIPIYDRSNALQGVLGVDLILSQIGEFLHNLKKTPRAKAIVLERNGMLIANSEKEPPYLNLKGKITRKPATASVDPLMSAAAKFLQQHFSSLNSIQSHQQLAFRFGGETQYIQLFPWKDAAGLDWLVMIVIPESDLLGEMQASALYIALVSLAALAVAVALGLFTSHRIVQAVRRLGQASQAIADGQLDYTIVPSRIREMSNLSAIFNRMAEQLRSAFEGLELRVEERTLSLRQAEEKFRSIFENASDGIYQTTPEGRYQSANLALARLYGYASAEALIATIQNIPQQLYVDPERRNDFVRDIEVRGHVTAFEAQVYRQDGSIIWISENARAVKNSQGNLLYYEGIVTDITRRKLAEDALRDSEQKLRQQNEALVQLAKNRAVSEGRLQEALQEIADTAADLFAIARVSIWLYELDPARVTCTLLQDGDMQVQTPNLSLHQSDCPKFFEAIMAEPWIAASDIEREPRLGKAVPIYLIPNRITALLAVAISVSNQFLGMLCLEERGGPREWSLEEEGFARSLADLIALALEARDRKQAELALSQAKELAESANQSKSQFLSNMSHELRTPLNAVIGFTQILQRDSSLNPDQQQYINIINRSGEHLLGLINSVLEMSKIESGSMSLEENDFDVSRLLATVESMFRFKASDRGIELNIECANQVPCYLRADEGKLRQVLINLMGNAIKFTKSGHVTVRLNSQNRVPEEDATAPSIWLWVEVEDTGPGIAPEELELLFQAFRQTETGRKSQQGSGLGLSISRRFVELMGGQLQVRSTVGKGTIFSFQVAATRLEFLKESGDRPGPRIIGIAPHQPTCRILIVDDRPENRLVLVKLLDPLGFEVAEAENGQEAVDLSQSWQPHLILMDMRMPVMDGYEATRQIKALRVVGQPAIIALTASAFDEERNLILHTGCDDFVAKPFREALLLSKIAEYTGLEYIYEAASPTPTPSSGTDVAAAVFAADVAALVAQMPLDWQQAVYQAACRGDDDTLLQLVVEMPEESQAAARTMVNWVNNFQFELIMQLMQSLGLEGK